MAHSIIRGNTRGTTAPSDRGPVDRRRWDQIVNGVALTAAAAVVGWAGWQTLAEYRVVEARDAARAQAGETGPVPPGLVESSTSAASLPPRISLLRGMMRARAAAVGPTAGPAVGSAAAARLLEQAAAEVARARKARPVWGEAEVAATYVELLRGGADAPAAIAALRRSYAAAPFLRGSAPWRIRYAVAIWPSLDAATRADVVRETAWLARASGRTYTYARGLVAGSPAAPAVDRLLSNSGA